VLYKILVLLTLLTCSFHCEFITNDCYWYMWICSEQISGEPCLNEITSLMNSVAQTIDSRLEQLYKAKDCAGKYEEAFTAASTALTATKQQQTDANSRCQVI